MSDRLTPEAALDPAALARCYRGALALDDRSDRLAACYVLVGSGRLGLVPGELVHLHEGWIDWAGGALQVPGVDPCGCELCWESARVAQRRGDPRPLATIVDEDRWQGTARRVPFGYSRRLTGVLATALDAWPYLDRSGEDLRGLLVASAERATDVDPATVNWATLRASAAACFAAAGLDGRAIAAILGVEPPVAGAFVTDETDRASDRLRETFDGASPATAEIAGRYPLVASHDAIEGEPFDPATFDADWRAGRVAEARARADGSPRPSAVPDGIDVGPLDDVTDESLETATDDSLSAATDESSAEPAAPASDDRMPIEDVDDLVTTPVELVAHTRFASSSLLAGRPRGGRVVIGQSELALAAHGGGEITAATVVPLDAVRDLAFEWAPDRLAEIFETTIGLAFRPGDDREVAVIEIPPGRLREFTDTLAEGLLDGVTVVAKHPARVGGRITDAEPKRFALSITEGSLELAPAPGRAPEASIPLADVTDVERDARTIDDVGRGLAIEYVQPRSQPLRTVLAPTAERDRTLLERYLRWDRDRRSRQATDVSLDQTHEDILEVIQTTSGAKDIAQLLGLGPAELSDLVEDLADAGFVHDTPDGVHLTGMGVMRTDVSPPDRSD